VSELFFIKKFLFSPRIILVTQQAETQNKRLENLKNFTMSQNKPRVIKDYDKLDPAIQEQIKLVYPAGFSDHLIYYFDKDGKNVSALPFETDDKYYLIRMTLSEAEQIIEDDEDYDDDGFLKDSAREEYEDKYADMDYLAGADEEEEPEDEPEEDDGDDDDY